jgi:hypothetical protein
MRCLSRAKIIARYDACEGCGHYDTVVLVGHSYGGAAVMECIRALHNQTITMWGEEEDYCISVQLAFTIDPVKKVNLPKPTKPGDWGFVKDSIVNLHYNYYQRCDINSCDINSLGPVDIWGDSVQNATNSMQDVSGFLFTEPQGAHMGIVPLVQSSFATALKAVSDSKGSPGRRSPHNEED